MKNERSVCVSRLSRGFVYFLALWMGVCGSVWGKVNPGEGPDLRLLPLGDLLGMEAPDGFRETADGGVVIGYDTKQVAYDAEGVKQVEWAAEQGYSPETDVLVDLSVKGAVSVRRGTTGELLATYAFSENNRKALKVFFTDEGKFCHAWLGAFPFQLVTFDPMSGKVLRVDESNYEWSAVGSGPLVVSYTHLGGYPEQPTPPRWPVQETLYDSRTGEAYFGEELERTGWLYRGPFAEQQTLFVAGGIHFVDTAGEVVASGDLEGGQIVGRWLAPSANGNCAVALVRFSGEEDEEAYRVGVWDLDTESVTWIDWDETWGSMEMLVDLSVADSGEFVVLSLAGSGILKIDTETGEGDAFVGFYDELWESVAILEDDSLLLANSSGGSLYLFGMETKEAVYESKVFGRLGTFAHDWQFSSKGDVLFMGTDERLRRLDLGTLEVAVVAPVESPRVTAVWPTNEAGKATVLFADGSSQELDVETGEKVGERKRLLPAHETAEAVEGAMGMALLDDGRIYEVGTGELGFDLASVLDRDDLDEGKRAVIAGLVGSNGLKAKFLDSGERVAFFDGEGGAVFKTETQELIDVRERSWVELVEGESFLVARELVKESAYGADYRLAVYDSQTLVEKYRLAIPYGVVIGADGAHFAWVEEDLDSAGEGKDGYDWSFALRQFALEPMGFGEIEAQEWTEYFPSGEVPLFGTPQLLEYGGPDGSTFALVGLERVLEFSSERFAEWDRPERWYGRGTQVVQRTESGHLLLLDELNRVGVYGYFVPEYRSVDVEISEELLAWPDLTGLPLDRVDVWRSSDLEIWIPWDGRPVDIVQESPVFFRVIEWVAE